MKKASKVFLNEGKVAGLKVSVICEFVEGEGELLIYAKLMDGCFECCDNLR